MSDKSFNVDQFLRDFIKSQNFSSMGYPLEFSSLKGNCCDIDDRKVSRCGVFKDCFGNKFCVEFTIDTPTEHVLSYKIVEINDKDFKGKAVPSLAANNTGWSVNSIKTAASSVVSQYLKKADSMEIGDQLFPLRIDTDKHLAESHPWVGRTILVNNNARGDLSDKVGTEGKISGVVIVNNQPLGLEVVLNSGGKFRGPIKDFNFPK
jgi:hypothetical protein